MTTHPAGRRSLRLFSAALFAVALALVAAACGTTEEDSADDSTTDETADAVENENPDDDEDTPTPGDNRSSCEDDTTATSTEPVSLTDSFGRSVELDAPAERVAVLEWQQIEDTLTLCVTPVAVADVDGYNTWVNAEPLPSDVADVGTRGEPNFDALVAADPDLVIVEAYSADEEIIGQVENLGLTVLATSGADAEDPIENMIDTFTLIAEATGRSERAAVVVDEFETHLTEAKQAVSDVNLEIGEFVYLDGWIQGGNVSLRPFGQGSLVGEIGEELGLTNAWTGEVDAAYGLGQTDIEGMTAVGDAMILYTGTSDPEADIIPELEKNPIWNSLPAIEDGRAFAFPEGTWTFGGPRSSQQIIDAYVDVLTR